MLRSTTISTHEAILLVRSPNSLQRFIETITGFPENGGKDCGFGLWAIQVTKPKLILLFFCFFVFFNITKMMKQNTLLMDTDLLLVSPLFPFKSKHDLICRPPFLHFPRFRKTWFSSKVEKIDFSSIRRIKSIQNDNAIFDEAAYEAERLSKDAEARKAMAEASQKETRNEADPKAWKWIIRKWIWDLMEAQNIAQFPRPVHHRIPNFVGAHVAANKVSK